MTRRLGRYELVHRLGAGGGGEVWEAVLHGPAGFRRRVALKLLHEGSTDAAAREALVQEARLGALVAHPHVVPTLELGEHEGQWFFVMDLVRGCTTTALRKRGVVPAGALLDIGVQTCDGLAHIHELTDQDGWPLALVHRDIKPGNLMVDASRQVRIVDLGIARLQGTEDISAGTPGFVAPEQLRGDEGPRADVFALGVTLTYLALGRLPFGKGGKAIARVVDPTADARATDPELLAALDAYLPGLGAVLSRAMRFDPDLRWPTARAFGAALQGLYSGCSGSMRLSGLTILSDGESGDVTGGLTTERGAFVGREAELDALRALLDSDARWVVVVGPGGVGKTRLVDEVSRARGVVRVDASKARTLPGLCYAVADVLGAQVGPDPIASVGASLGAVSLLVVDEIEQVVDAAAEALPAWLAAVPGLRILCSSRVAPGHSDATLVRVGPMSMADSRRLFALRIGGDAPAEVMDGLVRALDRLPLALELAAARARKTSPARVLAQIEATSSAQVPTLRASLQASWDLLEPVDREAMVRLAAYEGSFDARDAVAVLDPDQQPLERLERLVEHSMLHVRGNRFRLLTSVRAFVRAQLPERRKLGEVLHGRWMARHGRPDTLRVAYRSSAAARPMLDGMDDLLAASRRAVARGDADVAVATALAACQGLHRVGPVSAIGPLVDALLPLGVRRVELMRTKGRAIYSLGHVEEAETWLAAAREEATGLERRRIEMNLAAMRFKQGLEGAITMLQDALEELEAAGEGPSSVHGRILLGQLHYLSHRLVAAQHHLTLALANCEQAGRDPGHVRGMLAVVLKRRGHLTEAVEMMQQTVDEFDAAGDTLMRAVWTMNLSSVRYQLGQAEEAERLARRAIELARTAGRPVTEGIAHCVLSEIAVDRGDLDAASALATSAMKASSHSDDANLQSEVELARGRVLCLQGRVEEGVAALERAWNLAFADLETRTTAALWMARYGPPEKVLGWLRELTATLDEEVYLCPQHSLVRAEAELQRGALSEARGALLQGTAELASLDLPAEAPVPKAFAALRRRLASA